jgi:hypothetical protein
MDRYTNRWLRIGGLVLLVASLGAFLAVCKGKTAEEAGPAPAESQPVVFSLNAAKVVLGTAVDDQSGLMDLSQDEQGFTLAYRYYDTDLQNIDVDMAADLAPKIEKLYQDFKSLDHVVFQISVNSETPGEWKPYVSFAMNRKTADEIDWSGLLSERFLQSVLDLQRYE